MNSGISVIMITKNAEKTLKKSLDSVNGFAGEIIIVDDFSNDTTVDIAKRYTHKIFQHHEINLGKQKQYALNLVTTKWILSLDSDEAVSDKLKNEIKVLLHNNTQKDGYYIKFQNHLFGRSLQYGGENYKVLRLFKKSAAIINPALVHEHITISSDNVGELHNYITHYSYRSFRQIYTKFTDYALREAKQKFVNGERSSIKKNIFISSPYVLGTIYKR